MCCEATDALLEYIRRSLGLTGLRGLNAPRRLKLRVPVLKEWLLKQGQKLLSDSIPDWDPVRKPTGRWKGWEIIHLKPIMDEKAVERQAKRSLMAGERDQAGDAMGELIESRHAAALQGLKALKGCTEDTPPSSQAVAVIDDTAAAAASSDGTGTGEEESGDDVDVTDVGARKPAEAKPLNVIRALNLADQMQELLTNLVPEGNEQVLAVQHAQQAANALRSTLQTLALAKCLVRTDNRMHLEPRSRSSSQGSVVVEARPAAAAGSQKEDDEQNWSPLQSAALDEALNNGLITSSQISISGLEGSQLSQGVADEPSSQVLVVGLLGGASQELAFQEGDSRDANGPANIPPERQAASQDRVSSQEADEAEALSALVGASFIPLVAPSSSFENPIYSPPFAPHQQPPCQSIDHRASELTAEGIKVETGCVQATWT